MRHCDTCTCGLTRISWSDRENYVNLSDPNDVAEQILYCALDHHYDRTENGIPFGIPKDMEELLAPILNEELTKIEPKWEYKTIYLTNSEVEHIKTKLVEALNGQQRINVI